MLDNPQMRVAVALLVDDELSNRTWKPTMHWHKYGFDFRVLRLPPHISLKQPFIVPSLTSFEAFFDRLAEQTNAQPIFLDGFRLYESGDEAVVVLTFWRILS